MLPLKGRESPDVSLSDSFRSFCNTEPDSNQSLRSGSTNLRFNIKMGAQKMELMLRMKFKTIKKDALKEISKTRLSLREFNMNLPLSRASFEISNTSLSSCLSTSRDSLDENSKIKLSNKDNINQKSSNLKNFHKRGSSINRVSANGKAFELREDSGSKEVERAINFLKNL